MRVITLNANGIRAAVRKGLLLWLQDQNADVICLQETKAQLASLALEPFELPGYHFYYADAEKKGYSGVAIYSRIRPNRVVNTYHCPVSDREGRYLELQFSKLSICSVYFPSGTSGEVRQNIKYEFLERFMTQLLLMRRRRRSYIIAGDLNIAHRAIDLTNDRSNQKNSGFLPEERAWLDDVFSIDFHDAFRVVEPTQEAYTWWSNRGQAWTKNVGWRIDYQVISKDLVPLVHRAQIYTKQRFSDHAPLIIDYQDDFFL